MDTDATIDELLKDKNTTETQSEMMLSVWSMLRLYTLKSETVKYGHESRGTNTGRTNDIF